VKRIEDPGFDSLMGRWQALGVVLECVPFALEGADGRDRGVHRAAALATLEDIRINTTAWSEAVTLRYPPSQRPEAGYYGMWIEPDLLGDGEPVEKEAFIGPYCDLQGRRLLMRGTAKNHPHDLFWFGDPETPRHRVPPPTRKHANGSFTDAYLDPPYGLSGTPAERNAAFFDALDLLFDGLRGDCTIHRWSDAASNYFDDGREWWGTHFWTVHASGADRIVGVVASATD